MVVYTDSIDYAQNILPPTTGRWSPASTFSENDIGGLTQRLFEASSVYETTLESNQIWNHVFITEAAPHSQYDLLIELNRGEHTLPEGILCVAGAGDKFHGFKDRPWTGSPGNLHLSAHLAPAKPVDPFGVGFMILAAVSVIDAIDRVPGLVNRAGIKWVNDILINDAKVCGVLAYTQTMKDTVTTAVLGIGLNVETTPSVEPTPFVPQAASLRELAPDGQSCNQRELFGHLSHALDRNYRSLVNDGYRDLLGRYRERSVVLGREVAICSDNSGPDPLVIARGRVSGLGENLELMLEGVDKPFSKGRLILES